MCESNCYRPRFRRTIFILCERHCCWYSACEDLFVSLELPVVGEAHTVIIAHDARDAKAEVCTKRFDRLTNSMTQAMVFAWGDPNDSRLGGVDVRRHHLPQPVKLLSDAMKRLRLTIASASPQNTHSIIACGVAHTILLTATGQLLTWGCGKYGQLGYGNLWDREDPVVVPSLRSVTSFAAGDRHSIAV